MLCSRLHICNYHVYIQQDLEYNFKPSLKNVWESKLIISNDHPTTYDMYLMENQVMLKLMISWGDLLPMMVVWKFQKLMRQTLFELATEGIRK